MATLYSDVTTLVRTRIREDTANEISDAEIRGFISLEERSLFDRLGLLPGAGRSTTSQEFTLAADVTTKDLTTLTEEFVSIEQMEVEISGLRHPMPVIHPGEEWRWENIDDGSTSPAVIPGYFIRDTTMTIKPPASDTRTFRITYEFRPAVKSSAGSSLATPIRWDDRIVCGVALRVFEMLGQGDKALERRIIELDAEIENVEVNRVRPGRIETVRRTTTSHWRRR